MTGTPEYKLVVWQEPNGLVYQAIRSQAFLSFSVGDTLDMLEGNTAKWVITKVSHSIYRNGDIEGHQVTLTVEPV
jgi:hypothetical protein